MTGIQLSDKIVPYGDFNMVDASRVAGGSGNTLDTDCLPDSGITAGQYNTANIVVDAKGRITAASQGVSVEHLSSFTQNSNQHIQTGIIKTTNIQAISNTNITFRDSTGTAQLTIDQNNTRLGINTTSPANTLDVNGNISCTTLVSGELGTNVTATTQANSDNTTKVATTAFVKSYVDNNSSGGLWSVSSSDSNNIYFDEKVGIGTNNPLSPLHIKESVSSTNPIATFHNETNGSGAVLEFNDSLTGTQSAYLGYYHQDGSSQGGSASFHFWMSGQTVLVAGNSGNSGRVVVSSSADLSKTDYGFYNDWDTGISRMGTNAFSLIAGGNERVKINSSGILINTSGTGSIGSTPLYITRQGNTAESLKIHIDDSSAIFQTFQDETSGERGNFIFIMDNGTASFTDFRHGTTSLLKIKSSGNIGINTASPTYNLHVVGTGLFSDTLIAGSSGEEMRMGYVGHSNWAGIINNTNYNNNGSSSYAIVQNSAGTTILGAASGQSANINIANSTKLTANATGVGILQTSPTVPLHIGSGVSFVHTPLRAYKHGNNNSYDWAYYGQNWTGTNISVVASGGITTGAGFYSYSDRRIKRDIRDINDQESLETVLNIMPKKYKYRDKMRNNADRDVIGYIAQDLKSVIPEMVNLKSEFIPNIQAEALVTEDEEDSILEFNFDLPQEVEVNQKIKMTGGNGSNIEAEIIDIVNARKIKINHKFEPEQTTFQDIEDGTEILNQIFVYGVEIGDFHAIKKEMIQPLLVSAIQELNRKIESLEAKLGEK